MTLLWQDTDCVYILLLSANLHPMQWTSIVGQTEDNLEGRAQTDQPTNRLTVRPTNLSSYLACGILPCEHCGAAEQQNIGQKTARSTFLLPAALPRPVARQISWELLSEQWRAGSPPGQCSICTTCKTCKTRSSSIPHNLQQLEAATVQCPQHHGGSSSQWQL